MPATTGVRRWLGSSAFLSPSSFALCSLKRFNTRGEDSMNKGSDRGQVLIIGAVAMVVLLAIAGLVIDLGFSWMLRRSEQNAVDPATIAAARYIPDGDLAAMEEAACFYARENGFFPDATTYDLGVSGCVPANDPNGAVLTVNWPPASGPFANSTNHVQVLLNSSHATFFSRVLGFDTMSVTTSAVAANGSGDSGVGQLVALDPTTCGAGQVRGNGDLFVEGSVYVNSDGSGPPACPNPVDDNCSPSASSGAFNFAGINARLHTPQLSVRGTCANNSNAYPLYCSPTRSICRRLRLPGPASPQQRIPRPGPSRSPTVTIPLTLAAPSPAVPEPGTSSTRASTTAAGASRGKCD
jgi:hypothetical protein